ncbi:RNA-directed DNA polymerase from mobile element jockey [Araneus ventricosus]|nr:RNA-directed DNA polymerase from mobile element jockey [Araneus ventricosus]
MYRDNYLIFPEVTEVEISRIFSSSANDKAPGPDGLTTGIIRELYDSNKNLFINIMNTLLCHGYFPTIWKEARVALIPKEGKDLKIVTSYRPICLLSTWGKILDKVITKRLQFELEVNGKFDDCQHGFRRGKSTLSALQVFTDFIKSAKDEKLITLAIAFDISNAFNSIRWKDIMTCLQEDNISEYLLKIIASFLSDRKIVDYDFDILSSMTVGFPRARLWDQFCGCS